MGMTFSINPTANLSQARFMHLATLQNGTADGPSGQAGSYTTTLAGASSPSPANLVAPPAATMPGSIATGEGGTGCSCSCLCGVAAFPAGAGIGMFGGMPGQFLPSPLKISNQWCLTVLPCCRSSSGHIEILGVKYLIIKALDGRYIHCCILLICAGIFIFFSRAILM